MRIRRFLRIFSTIGAYGLDEFIPPGNAPALRLLMRVAFFWRDISRPRGERLRLALESLGPVFVKFGQLLSVRRDLIPEDIADELAKLQDAVPPFAWPEVARALDRAYGRPHTEIFASFQEPPIASASVAQVHFATLVGGREVAVKILRPGIVEVIAQDVELLYVLAGIVERSMPDGKRLRPREVVREFENTIADELDLVHEAANASQLKRNFADERLLVVPEVYWDFCNRDVMVMARVDGIPVNDVPALRAAGIDIPKLARDGVEIFYTQVFRDGFFHADMHPGNILVARDGRYCGVDFGIMGTLSDADKSYLAINMRAFFERNYRKAAQAHVDAGWVPTGTRVDQFESALRALCEPVFDRPLKEIYFGKLLCGCSRSGGASAEVQPQLTLLLKTMLQVEGWAASSIRTSTCARRAADPRALRRRADGCAASQGRCARRPALVAHAAAAAATCASPAHGRHDAPPGVRRARDRASAARADARDDGRRHCRPAADCRIGPTLSD
jgi:ubiquinone biosynthesis protein